MKLRVQLLVLTLSLFIQYNQANTDCYSTDKVRSQNQYYALQTAAPNLKHNVSFDSELSGCHPERIWLLNRHGTRYPSQMTKKNHKYLEQLRDRIVKTDNICPEDYELIKNWKPISNTKWSTLVNPQGWNDLENLANFYKIKYPTLFNHTFSEKKFKFAHSSASRTKSSCQAFINGLFGPSANISHTTDDVLLMPHSRCRQYATQLRKQQWNKSEVKKFSRSSFFKNTAEAIGKRFGVNNITMRDLIALYGECTFQQSYNLTLPSPWCVALNERLAEILEYGEDLFNYYRDSYGFTLSQKLPCVLIKDLIKQMDNPSTTSNKVTAYFSHSTTLLMMLSALGAHHDSTPLKAHNFLSQKNRQFRVSKISPYASSFAAIKYQCPTYHGINDKIVLLLNQQPVQMKWCKGGFICTVSEFRKMFDNSPMRYCPHKICGNYYKT